MMAQTRSHQSHKLLAHCLSHNLKYTAESNDDEAYCKKSFSEPVTIMVAWDGTEMVSRYLS